MVLWLYEQPHTSLLWEHPRMQEFLRKCKVFRSHMYMGAYGAASPKPTFLWAPTPAVQSMSLPLPEQDWQAMVTRKTLEDGRSHVTGNAYLKGSQTYPKKFGLATLQLWQTVPKRGLPQDGLLPTVRWHPRDSWKDAELNELVQYLSLGTFKL